MCEDVHGSTFPTRHANLPAQKLADDAGDSPTTHDCERMTAIRGNDAVFGSDAVFETDRYRFLQMRARVLEAIFRGGGGGGCKKHHSLVRWPNGRSHGSAWTHKVHLRPSPSDASRSFACTSPED